MVKHVFVLPDLGEGLEEAEIVEWHVSVGDRVVADQPLVSVETDKAVVEVPSPWSGTVTALHSRPGEMLRTGAALAEIDDGSRSDTGAIVGAIVEDQAPEVLRPDRPAEAARSGGNVRAVPAARARARELGLDITKVAGTGPDGAITRADIKKAAGAKTEVAQSGARRSMARTMARAHAAVVPATVMDVADITGWHRPDVDVTVRLVRAICAAAMEVPALNTWYDPDAVYGDQPAGLSLGLAVDTPQGLYVPVIGRADSMTTAQLRAQLDDAIARIRARRPADEAAGPPTITLSNFGAIGGRHAALVVVPPQVAILGAGRAYDAVVWREDSPGRATLLPLSLSFDHRAVTGGEAARFLAAIIADLELSEQEET